MFFSQFNFLILLILFTVIPLIFLWIKYNQTLKRYKKTIILATLCSAFFGGLWQYLAIKTNTWAYSGKGTTNIWILGVPLEEHLFNILVGSLITHVTLTFKNHAG